MSRRALQFHNINFGSTDVLHNRRLLRTWPTRGGRPLGNLVPDARWSSGLPQQMILTKEGACDFKLQVVEAMLQGGAAVYCALLRGQQ